MNRKLIITKAEDYILSAICENDRIKEIRVDEPVNRLGDIYIGKVKNLVPSLGAAFIEIEPGLSCYFQLDESESAILTGRKHEGALVPGDELLVEVSKEAQRGKQPSVSSNLTFTGKYLILTTARKEIGVSRKIKEPERTELKTRLCALSGDQFGYIVRTNAVHASVDLILDEAQRLREQCCSVLEAARTRKCFTKMRNGEDEYKRILTDVYENGLDEIITDSEEVLADLKEIVALPAFINYADKLMFYRSPTRSLMKTYQIDDAIRQVRKRVIWLKSGANIVIDQTEAMTVIDVNTGKIDAHRKNPELLTKVNMEAAAEIAAQIRLRNLSGIILVDFINLEKSENCDALLDKLRYDLEQDPVPTQLIDVTQLMLVEIVRKKIRKPIAEYRLDECAFCHES